MIAQQIIFKVPLHPFVCICVCFCFCVCVCASVCLCLYVHYMSDADGVFCAYPCARMRVHPSREHQMQRKSFEWLYLSVSRLQILKKESFQWLISLLQAAGSGERETNQFARHADSAERKGDGTLDRDFQSAAWWEVSPRSATAKNAGAFRSSGLRCPMVLLSETSDFMPVSFKIQSSKLSNSWHSVRKLQASDTCYEVQSFVKRFQVLLWVSKIFNDCQIFVKRFNFAMKFAFCSGKIWRDIIKDGDLE